MIKLKFRKLALGLFTVIFSTGLLFGCATDNEEEPVPNDEPIEQEDQMDEQEPDPTEEPSEEK